MSNEEVDDLAAIRYGNKAACAEICTLAKHRLTTLSASRLEPIGAAVAARRRAREHDADSDCEGLPSLTSFRSLASPRKAPLPLATTVTNTCSSSSIHRRSSLFPRLDLIVEQSDVASELATEADAAQADASLASPTPPQLTPPPPTYSDSESMYSTMRGSGATPSAPCLS